MNGILELSLLATSLLFGGAVTIRSLLEILRMRRERRFAAMARRAESNRPRHSELHG